MPEPMNIADVLQAGYFPTSRARGRPADDSSSSSSSGDGGGGSNNNSDDDNPARRRPRRRAGSVYIPNHEPPSPPPQALTSNGSPTFRDALPAGIPDPTVRQSRSRLDGVDADFGSAGVEHPPASPTTSGYQSPRHHRQQQQQQQQQQRHTCNTSRRRLYPPSPSVEDEADSLAREHCRSSARPRPAVDDEIPSKGDLEQCPIILEVHEHNPERRFVLVTPNDDSDDCYSPADSPSGSVKYPPDAAEPYEANTGRKYDAPLTAATAAATTKRMSSDRDVRSGLDPPKRTRVRSTSCVNGAPPQVEQHQQPPPPRPTDGVPSRRSPPIDTYSGPEIVKQTAGGRERAYYDYSRPANGLSPSTTRNSAGGGATDGQHHQRSRSSYCDDRRYDDNGPVSSPQVGSGGGSGSGRRTQSTVESTASLDRFPDSLPGGGSRQEGRPSDRAGSLYMRSGRSREPRRDSPPRRDDGHSSDEGKAGGLRPPAMLVRKATMDIGEGEDVYISPDTVVHPSSTARSRGRAPTMPPPSRGPLKVGDDFSAGPRHSMPTLPMTEEERSGDGGADADPPYPTDDDSPRGGRSPVAPPPPLSRTRSRSRAPSAMRLSMPAMPMPMGPQSPTVSAASDRRSGQFGSDPRSPPMVSGSPGGGGGGNGGGGGYWQPGVFDPDQARLGPDRPRGAYRRYSEDLAQTPRMPECRRRKPVAGKRDWMTLEQCPNFNICPTCFDGVFRDSALVAIHFIPAAGRPAELPIACDFGAVPWYRIAWLVMLKNRRADDLTPFHRITTAVKNAVLKGECCPGDRKTTRTWYSVVNPETRQHISRFDVCYSCASSIEIILPGLRGAFTPKRTATAGGEPTRSRCAMHFLDERKRFVQYFDVLETFADRAAAATAAAATTTSGGGATSPAEAEALARAEAEQLALQLERLASFVECREDKPIKDGGWHVMRNLPSLTVCGDCFDEVVRPRLEEGSMVARNFYVNAQRFPALTTCQLYSDRMQEVFRKACRKNDITYLETRVRERKEVEDGIRAKLEWLAKERDRERDRERGSGDREAKRLQERIDQLVHEWKKWE